MTLRARTLFVLAAIFVSSCATAPKQAWYRYSGSLEEARRDVSQCRYDVARTGEVKGYTTGLGTGADTITDENSVMLQCMANRGYDRGDLSSIESLSARISRAAATARNRNELAQALGPCADQPEVANCSFVRIWAVDPGPMGMDWYPQSRMDVLFQQALFRYSPAGIIEGVSQRQATDIFPVK